MMLFFLICLFLPYQIYSSEKLSPEVVDEPIGISTLHYCFPREPVQGNKIPPTRTMIMIFNDSERGINTTITNTLASALYQTINSTTESAYCILTSASLLQNIIAARHFAQSVYQALIKTIIQDLPSFNTTSMLTVEQFQKIKLKTKLSKKNTLLEESIIGHDIPAQLALYLFDPEFWNIYEVNDFLYLLVPKSLITNKSPYDLGLKIGESTLIPYQKLAKKLVPDTEKEPAQALEKTLKQLRPKNNDYSFRGALKSQKGAVRMSDKSYKYAIPATHIETNEKTKTQSWRSSLFFTRSEYAQAKKLDQIPQWSFYITGHGTTNKVAELDIGDFQAMLNFFEAAILTRLCIISSCYAAGVNVEKVYQESDDYVTRLTYSFPIVLEASYDLPVRGTAKRLNPNKKHPFLLDFSLFAAEMQKPFAAYQDVLFPLLATLRTPGALKKDINIPLLRPERRETFIPLYKTLEITEIMAQTRNKPLEFRTFYTKLKKAYPVDTVIVLLKTNFIPFPLDISDIPLAPFFVAELANQVYYYISEIKADMLDDILDSLQRNYVPQKSFLIKTVILENTVTYTDAFIYTDAQEIVHMIARKVKTNEIRHYLYDPQHDSRKKAPLTAQEAATYEKQLQKFSSSLEPAKQAEIKKLEQTMATKLRTQPLQELQMQLSLLSFIATKLPKAYLNPR